MLEINYLKCYLALRVKFNGVKKKDMKLDIKTLLIGGAVAVGGYLWYKNRQKQNALAIAQPQSDDGGETLGGGGGFGGGGGSTSPTPTTATAPVVVVPTTNTIEAKPTKEPILATKPTTQTTIKPTTRPISQSKPTAITSKFLTFDGEYAQNDNVVLDFEGNID